DEQGRLGFTGFNGRVVRVTIVDADGGVHAVFAELRSPAAASEPGTAVRSRQYATGLRVDIAVGATRREVGVVSGDDALGAGRRQGFEDRVYHRLRDGHPPAQCRRLRGTDDATWREHDAERSKGALVDRQEQRGREAFKRHLTGRTTSRRAGIKIARDLGT